MKRMRVGLRLRVLFGISVVLGVLLGAAAPAMAGPAMAARSDATAASAAQAGTFVYIVKPGDTLNRIAARYGVTVSELQALNRISNPNRIYAGQALLIPTSTTPPPTGPARLQFKPGATSIQVSGQLVQAEVRSYLVRAGQGQVMIASVDSPGDGVWLGISGYADGRPLLRIPMGMTQWHGTLPASQDYMVSVAAKGGDSTYNLQITIPARISFQPGAYSGSVSGYVAAGTANSYTLKAMAGQTITVDIISPARNVLLTIWGLEDGQPLVRYITAATSYTGVLPATQDYVIEARAGGGASSYTVKATVR